MEPYQLGLGEAACAIRKRELSAADLAQALIARRQEVEPSLHALAWFDADRLLKEAQRIDRRLAAMEQVGPLAGVPIGVKDIFNHAGVPTGAGIRDREPAVPTESAPCLERLRVAGAILYGKTATTERAFLDPASTRNPWNLRHTPGGSSSGSAAGTAARMFPAALGTQTAGSVIRPAAFCGVIGMTITHGRVPLEGVHPLAPRFDTAGFFVRSIDDAELLLAAWCGDDVHGPLLDELPLAPLERPVFLGLARRGFVERTEDEAAHQVLHASRLISQKGAVVHVLKVPASLDVLMAGSHRRILAFEAARIHRKEFEKEPGSFGPKIAQLLDEGLRVVPEEYHRALEHLDRFRRDMLERIAEVDAIILPAAAGAAPAGIDTTGDPQMNAPWTAVGFPCITIPIALSQDGLPLGLQIVGKPMGERHLLRVARACEQAIGFGCPEPPIPAER